MRDNLVENPMVLPIVRYKPRYREVIDELNNEHYIVDDAGREVDPGLLCEEED